jgi:lysophospholipase L1-like esterase
VTSVFSLYSVPFTSYSSVIFLLTSALTYLPVTVLYFCVTLLLIMKYLIVGDSHVWDLPKYLRELDTNATSLIISKGRRTAEVIQMYRDELFEIVCFDPEVIVIHLGHNDMAEHRIHNVRPPHPLAVTAQLIGFAGEVATNFPSAKFLLSATLPRCHTETANLPLTKIMTYNKSCKRLGQGLRHDATPHGIQVGLNNRFWAKISKALQQTKYYLPDGLHLNPEGKRALAKSWLIDLKIIPDDQPTQAAP